MLFCCAELARVAAVPEHWKGKWTVESKIWLRLGEGDSSLYRCSGWLTCRFCPICGAELVKRQ